jgi:translation initiation factor 6
LLGKCDLSGSAYIGIFCACNNEVALIPDDAPPKFERMVSKYLGVETVHTNVGGGRVIGALVTMNSMGIIITNIMIPEETKRLKAKLGGRFAIAEIDTRINAFGNTILANDNGAVVHPSYGNDVVKVIKDTLGVEVVKGRVANMDIVGSCGVANSKGVLLHPKSTQPERKMVSETLGVKVSISTANCGCPHLRSCVLVNDNGALVGSRSTTVEIDRIFDVLC